MIRRRIDVKGQLAVRGGWEGEEREGESGHSDDSGLDDVEVRRYWRLRAPNLTCVMLNPLVLNEVCGPLTGSFQGNTRVTREWDRTHRDDYA